jgi:hypothetical protein
MQEIRQAGCVADFEELAVLFRGLERLESMVATIRETDETPAPDPALAAVLANRLDEPLPAQDAPKKKALPPIL